MLFRIKIYDRDFTKAIHNHEFTFDWNSKIPVPRILTSYNDYGHITTDLNILVVPSFFRLKKKH